MKKHYLAMAMITLLVCLAVGAWGLAVEASPSKQTTLVINYNNVLTASFVASELGLPTDRVALVDPVLCDVTFNLPLRTDRDEHDGQLVRTRDIVTLDSSQQRRLDELMGAQGCFRSR